MELTDSDIRRFSRHLLLPGFTIEHQLRLKKAKVVIIGLGGLGSPVAQYLAAAGVGRLTLVDHDFVDSSNLSRQILYSESDMGQCKATAASTLLQRHYPDLSIDTHVVEVTRENATTYCSNHDLLIDCTDLPSVKHIIDTAAGNLKIPVVSGAVSRFEAQVSVFHGNAGTSYSSIFSPSTGPQTADNCATLGIWGPAAGIVGSIMAQEALRMLAYNHSELDGQLMCVDLQHYVIQKIQLKAAKRSFIEESPIMTSEFSMIQPKDVANLKQLHPNLIHIHLSEEKSKSAFDIGSQFMTLDELIWASQDWEKNSAVLISCQHGIRSRQGSLILSGEGFRKVYCIEGGLTL